MPFILVNGSLHNEFKTKWGLWQGDLLFCYPIMATKGLHVALPQIYFSWVIFLGARMGSSTCLVISIFIFLGDWSQR